MAVMGLAARINVAGRQACYDGGFRGGWGGVGMWSTWIGAVVGGQRSILTAFRPRLQRRLPKGRPPGSRPRLPHRQHTLLPVVKLP